MARGDNTEQCIMAAAEAEFLEKGFALATTTDIAREAGVTHAMLHYYFRTKEKLFERIFQEKVRLMSRSLEVAIQPDKPVLVQLTNLVGAHYDFIAANPRLPFFVLNEMHLNEARRKTYQPILLEGLANTVSKVDLLLEQALKRGEVRPIRAADFLLTMASLNIMTFVALPTLRQAFALDGEATAEFVRQRRAENIETLLSRIRI